jgi:hypothetical protein
VLKNTAANAAAKIDNLLTRTEPPLAPPSALPSVA